MDLAEILAAVSERKAKKEEKRRKHLKDMLDKRWAKHVLMSIEEKRIYQKIFARKLRAKRRASGWIPPTPTEEQRLILKERQRRYRDKYPDRSRAAVRKSARKITLRKYNLTEEDYQLMLIRQNNQCAICKSNTARRVNSVRPRLDWCIDHDPQTGMVRGLLCFSCNITLGHCNDDPNLLRTMANYLEGKL